MRLDKALELALNISRKDAKELLKRKLIKVNDKLVKDSGMKISKEDSIEYNGVLFNVEEYIYLIMNKPAGYLTSTEDKDPTVMDLIHEYQKYELFPVGRLDKDTTGLLLITNDGELAHKLLSPTSHVMKTYLATSIAPLTDEDINKVKDGIMMDGKITNPISINRVDELNYEVNISDGKYHEVKRIFEYLNNQVVALKRIKFGDLKLPTYLKEGNYIKIEKESI